MSYIDSKKEIDKIRSKYNCAGDIIVKTAIQYIVEYGQYMFKDEEFIEDQKQQVNDRHDVAEKKGKILVITRDFEMAILDCAIELARVNTYDLIIYMQKECYWSNEGGLDYKRSVELLEKCMCWMEEQEYETSDAYEVFKGCGFEDNELKQFRFSYLIPEDEEKEGE